MLGSKTLGQAEEEVFLESEDWQTLLQNKFKAQEAAVSATGKDGQAVDKSTSQLKASSSQSAALKRQSVLGA